MGALRGLLGHRLRFRCLWLGLDLGLVLAACLLRLRLLGLVFGLLFVILNDNNLRLWLRLIIILRHRVPPGGFIIISCEVNFHLVLNFHN